MGASRQRPAQLLTVFIVGLAGCSGGGAEPGATTGTLVIAGAAVATTAAPADSSAGSTDRPATTTADTGVDSAPPANEPEREEIRSETPLAAGSYRTTELAGPVLEIDVDLPVDGLYAVNEEGSLVIGEGDSGELSLLAVFHVDNGTVFQPTIDTDLLVDRAYGESVSSPPPADMLDWIAGRPGTTAGPVDVGDVGGLPSRRRTIEFGPFDGGIPCSATDTAACHFLFGAPATGLVFYAVVGDSFVIHELVVGGQRLIVLIDTRYDPEVSASIADSIRFVVTPHPVAPPGSQPMPFTGPLSTGTTYVHERSTSGVWLVRGSDGVETMTSRLRSRFIRLAADGVECMSFTDTTQGRWFGSEFDPDDTESRGVPIAVDIGDLLAASDVLEIVDGPTDVDLGDVTGTAYDVRPTGDTDVVLANNSTLAVAGQVTRVIAAPRVDGHAPDLVVVTVGSPCEALLDGLVFLSGAER